MTVTISKGKEKKVTFRLDTEIDHHTAAGIRGAVDKTIAECLPRVVCIDFSDVEFMDSSGIGLIMGRVGVAEGIGAALEITGLSDMQRRLLKMAGLEKLSGLTVL